MSDAFELLQNLKREYLSSLPQKMRHIESMFAELQSDPGRKDLLDELCNAAHKIRGSAGSYDLDELGSAAGVLEDNIQEIIDRGRIEESDLSRVLESIELLSRHILQ